LGETHEIAYVDLPHICAQPKGKLFSATCSNAHDLLKHGQKLLKQIQFDASFQYASNTCTLKFHNSQITFCEFIQFPHYSGKAESQCQPIAVEFGPPHEAICAGFFNTCLKILYSYLFSSLTPDVCHAWGGCGWHKRIPKHSKHHRQTDASLSAELDLAPHQSQSPSHVYSVQCLSKPASCAILLDCFSKHHPCLRRELPCSIHTPTNQTSRIEHGTHASRPPPTSP
jgi:hypothetical protein